MSSSPPAFPAVSHRLPLLALLTANGISQVGNTLTQIAVLWFVLQTTGSATKAGFSAVFMALPFAIAGVFGGALVDRLGFKLTSVLSDLASGLAIMAIPLLYHTVGLAFWQLLVLVFLGAVLDSPGEAARQSLIPDLARLGNVRLERVNAANEVVRRVTLLVGPLLAGVLIAVLGPSNVLWVDAATFAASAAMVAVAVPSATRHAGETQEAPENYVKNLLEGLRFIYQDRLIRSLMITLSVVYAVGTSLLAVVMPVYVKSVFGSAMDLGLILAGFGVGTIVGTLVFGAIGHRLPRLQTLTGALLLAGIPLFVLAATPSVGLTAGALVFRGVVFGPVNPLAMTIYHEQIPAQFRGRVFGTYMAMSAAVVALGMGLAGYLIETWGLHVTLLAMAALYFVASVSPLLNPALQGANQPGAVRRPRS